MTENYLIEDNLIEDSLIKDIFTYIENGSNRHHRIGVELEHFICDDALRPVSYEELSSILRNITELTGGTAVYEGVHIIGIENDRYYVTLEPAGQVEISIAPCEELKEIDRIYDTFYSVWNEELKKSGLHFVNCGVYPLVETGEADYSDLPLLPKKRYEIMDRYFQRSGRLGQYMMRSTAATHLSLDYSSLEDAVRKMRLMEKLSPVLQLLMENLNGEGLGEKWQYPHLLRTQIWNDTDKDRCGYLPGLFREEFSIRDYIRWITEKPLVVANQQGRLISAGGKSARQLLLEIKEGANYSVSHILSMFFFHIRLKNYIEVRVADSVPKEKMLSYAALLKGLFYNENSLKWLENKLDYIRDEKDILQIEKEIMRKGYDAEIAGECAAAFLSELFETAEKALIPSEQPYLRRIVTLPMAEHLYLRSVPDHPKAHSNSSSRMKEYISGSTARYHNRVVRTLYAPKLFTEFEKGRFSEIVTVLYGIIDKVIACFRNDPSYRKLFGFDETLVQLMLLESGYSCNIPIARVDVFYEEQTRDFHFCEFNTDGTSAMNEDRELNNALKLSLAYQEFANRFEVKSAELFDTWVEAFLVNYREFAAGKGTGAAPRVAIVDFMEKATTNEFYVFRDAFLKKGVPCEVCDIRELTWNGRECITKSGMTVNAVYRRAVTSDIMEHLPEVEGFLEAAAKGAICLEGSFITELMHNKILFKILHLEETFAFLTDREKAFIKAHVPYTVSLTADVLKMNELRESVFNEKDRWIIKPEDSYGSKGVHAGVEASSEEWRDYVESCIGQNYILQQFCTPYRTKNLDMEFDPEQYTWRDTSNLTGLFVYNGNLAGIYSRTSYDQMISTQYNEMTLATIVLK